MLSTKFVGKRFRLRHFFVVVLTAIAFGACSQVAHAVNSPLTGRVAAALGNDIANATVEVFVANTQQLEGSTTTDVDGLYSITVPDGTYDIKVTPPISSGLAAGSVNGVVVNGPTEQNITLVPALAVNFSGVLTDGAGNPVPYAPVILSGNTYNSVLTNANGAFLLQVAPGSYGLQVQAYIDSTAFYASGYVTLNSNTVRNIVIPTATLSGQVLTPANQPVSNVSISAFVNNTQDGDLSWSCSGSASNDANGNYSFVLLNGSANLSIYPPSNSGYISSSQTGIAINGNTLHNIILQTGISFSGQVTDGSGNPVPYASVILSGNTYNSAQSDANGNFNLTVAAGSYGLQIQAYVDSTQFQGSSYVTLNSNTVSNITIPSGTLSGQVLTPGNQPVSNVSMSGFVNNVQNGGFSWSCSGSVASDANGNYSLLLLNGTANLNIYPDPNSGYINSNEPGIVINGNTIHNIILQTGITFSGQVTDGASNPVPYASVILSGSTYNSVQSDANGNFSLTVASGGYGLQVQAYVDSSAFYASGYVTLSGNTVHNITIPTRTLTGTVVDINGQPVNGVNLSANTNNYQDGDLSWAGSTSTASAGNGNYSLLLLPGNVTLQVYPPPNTNFIQTQINNVVIGPDPNTLAIVLLTAQPPNPQADLTIEKTASANTVVSGTTVTYTITVTNDGPDTAESVVVTDNLPAELSYSSCSSTHNGTCGGTGNSRTVSFAALLPNATATITINAQVDNGTPTGTTISNTATVDSDTPDPEEDNASTAEVMVSNAGPDLSVPAGITVPTGAGTCSAIVDVGTATVTGNANGVTITSVRSDNLALAAPYPKGETIITWTATDAANQTATGTQTITVQDQEAPAINCPQDITVSSPSPAGAVVNFAATATDNCGGPPNVTYSQAPGSVFVPGTTTVLVTATDDAGNVSTCTFNVAVSVPPNTAGGKVTGSGGVTSQCGSADFNITAQVDKNGQVKGQVKFQDSSCNELLRSTSLTSLIVSNGEAWISGQALTNDGQPVTFTLHVEDRGEPGSADTLSIAVSDGYTASSTIINGNIQVHKVK